MQLNHLNLCVADLAEARDFFVQLLDFQVLEEKGQAIAVLTDGQGFTLVLSTPRAFGGEPPRYPDGFHVGFIVATPAEVDRAHDRLVAGLPLEQRPRKLHGSYSFYFTALGGLLFEIACPLA